MVVTFEEVKDRDEVLRKAGLLKGGQVHVTEDMSRKVRSCGTWHVTRDHTWRRCGRAGRSCAGSCARRGAATPRAW